MPERAPSRQVAPRAPRKRPGDHCRRSRPTRSVSPAQTRSWLIHPLNGTWDRDKITKAAAMWIRALYRSWHQPRSQYGDAVVVAFLMMQCLDGVFTYLVVGI